ncbi:MAG: glutamine--tRNA ligase/YqeY domain fusion protein [Prevotellaceae bacterium]|jgi:glutaminyl-tRNA synthetase|nr:glutamine--tRNA ligase/YqeY domain fusion protein [Prevotellaceae bacterium]
MITEDVTHRKNLNFIEQIVEADLKEGLNGGRVQTRFPPEPNGYLHIGHAKAICMDFGIAEKFGGHCNLRFDDTNPVKEDVEYVDAIMEDIQWLGFQWKNLYYASDYFEQLHDLAIRFIKEGKAYVDEQSAETIAEQKGTPARAGLESPFRNRPVEESLTLFQKMSCGEVAEGAMVLRAKIDMAAGNMHFRDPIMYRIITSHPHHRTKDRWKVYPMYDFAHGQSDYIEGVTHSICTLEFEVHRPLYDWYLDQFATPDYRPKQREFNRLNITYTLMSKRKLLQLVQEGLVDGWDDPRMPTLCGLRRRGYTPEAIRNFIDRIGYTKYDGIIDVSLLEYAVREDLNVRANRVNAVLNPVKLVITNYPEDRVEMMDAENNPEDVSAGTRKVPFCRELYIERDDFMENPPKGYFRLAPDKEVRLKYGYIVRCTGFENNLQGELETIYCEYDPQTRSGLPEASRKVKGTLHWVSARHALDAEVRLYDRLFNVPNPSESDKDFRVLLNPQSKITLTGCKVEPSLATVKALDYLQFQRIGYFCVDSDSRPEHLVFNRTVPLKDTWAKLNEKR